MAGPILCSELADFPNRRFGSGCIHYFRNMFPGYCHSILGCYPSLDFDTAVGPIHFAVDKEAGCAFPDFAVHILGSFGMARGSALV
jgi:hypothetical protein